MNTECSHCGHAFDAADNLAICPKCEQVFEPASRAPIQPPARKPEHRQLKFWGGLTCIAIGIVSAPILVGIPIIVLGCYLVKGAEFSRK
jgi:hypothetical protein